MVELVEGSWDGGYSVFFWKPNNQFNFRQC